MSKKKLPVFLSYSSKDKLFVRRLTKDLDNRNIGVWIDRREIKAGDSITVEIERGLRASAFFVPVLSKNSLKSGWVRKELESAVKAWTKGKSTTIPILLEKCRLPYFLEGIKYANFTSKYEIGLKELLQGLGSTKQGGLLSKHDEAKCWKMIESPSDSGKKLKQFGKEISRKSKRKVLIIGGGEIGTEIGIAARVQGWDVRAIICEKPSPIMYLPFYTEENKTGFRVIDFETKGLKPTAKPFFQYLFLPKLRDDDAQRMEDIRKNLIKFITLEKPDAVLLEDIFLTPQEWVDLVTKTFEDKNLGRKKPFFLPQPTKAIRGPGGMVNRYSDVFLNKVTMKKFLCEIGLKDHVLASEYQEEHGATSLEVDIKDLLEQELIPKKFEKQWNKIENALKHYKRIILKPACTSSGQGQFTLSSMSKLTARLVTRRLKILEEYRVPNRTYIIEPYLKSKVETCIVRTNSTKKSSSLMGIYYDKIDIGELYKEGLQGQMMLLCSRTNSKQNVPEDLSPLFIALIPGIIDKICEHLSVPFIYVEFFIVRANSAHEKTPPHVYVNEISYRPDDAGFITLISHERNQFELFVKNIKPLENDDDHGRHAEVLEPTDDWVCKTLVASEEIKVDESKIKYESPKLGLPSDDFQFKLYKKPLGKKPDLKIIGYQWHHKIQEENDEGKHILEMHRGDLGLSKPTFEQLIAVQEKMRKRAASSTLK